MTRSIEGPSWIVGSPESIERKGGRLTLPRTTDAVDDAVRMMHGCNRSKGETAEWFILDLTDWLFNVPLHPKEHKHFTLAFQGIYVAHLTQAQGSANAPFVCGRVAALIACLMQGVLATVFTDCNYMLTTLASALLATRNKDLTLQRLSFCGRLWALDLPTGRRQAERMSHG